MPLYSCAERTILTFYVIYSSLSDSRHCDQYSWANQGVSRLLKREPQVKKSYFHIDTPKGPSSNFMKPAYQLVTPSNTSTVLIYYIGDEKRSCWFSSWQCFKSKLEDLTSGHAHQSYKVYKMHVTKHTTTAKVMLLKSLPPATHCMPVPQPRNSKQVKNIRSNHSGCRSNICHMIHFTSFMNWLLTYQISYMWYTHILIWYVFAATKNCLISWIECFWYSISTIGDFYASINTCFLTHSV